MDDFLKSEIVDLDSVVETELDSMVRTKMDSVMEIDMDLCVKTDMDFEWISPPLNMRDAKSIRNPC